MNPYIQTFSCESKQLGKNINKLISPNFLNADRCSVPSGQPVKVSRTTHYLTSVQI